MFINEVDKNQYSGKNLVNKVSEEIKTKIKELHEQGIISSSPKNRLEKLKQVEKEFVKWKKKKEIKSLLKLFKSLANKNRLLMLKLIMNGISCPCEIEHITGLCQSTISHHLNQLFDAKVIKLERKGKWSVISTTHKEFSSDFFREIIKKS